MRFGVHAERAPRQYLEQLVAGSVTAGQRDERIGQVGHQRLALMHRVDDPQLGQTAVRQFAVNQRLRNDADRLAAGREHGVGEHTHQADVSGAEDQVAAVRRTARGRA